MYILKLIEIGFINNGVRQIYSNLCWNPIRFWFYVSCFNCRRHVITSLSFTNFGIFKFSAILPVVQFRNQTSISYDERPNTGIDVQNTNVSARICITGAIYWTVVLVYFARFNTLEIFLEFLILLVLMWGFLSSEKYISYNRPRVFPCGII